MNQISELGGYAVKQFVVCMMCEPAVDAVRKIDRDPFLSHTTQNGMKRREDGMGPMDWSSRSFRVDNQQ